MTEVNYLPDQYRETNEPKINHNYLQKQFSDYKEIFTKIEKLVISGDFTLGEEVNRFEQKFAAAVGAKYALGVGSGTDALFLSLKALGVGPGDEVITTPYTFYATIGAIVTAGAKPVFVDAQEDYNINPNLIEAAITSKTKAIMPVHWSGLICEMEQIKEIAKKHNLKIVEDACHAIKALDKDHSAGHFGDFACFSMHPLKNLNVWGDGGVVVTNSEDLYKKMGLLRNHGLINRNECEVFAYNSRLDSLQAVVANHLIEKIDTITDSRIKNAHYLDKGLSQIPQIKVPVRNPNKKQVFHIYVVRAEKREELQKYLISKDIDAKVHYPIPMHLQPAAKAYGYKKGDFPVAEALCDSVISFPVHEFIQQEDLDKIIESVKEFYQ